MKKNNRTNYEEFHKSTSVQHRLINENSFTYKIILSVTNKYINKSDKLLDIGCGAGTLGLYYASKGNQVVGIDISHIAVDSANESATFHKLKNATFKKIDFPTETPQEKFDTIIFTEVIEHLEDDTLALKKVYSLLKPGGVVIISTPSKNAPLYKNGYAHNFDVRVGHLRRYTVEELVKKCQKVGFEILETKKTEGVIRNFLYLNPLAGKSIRFIRSFLVDIVLKIDWISMKLFGESDIFVVARKPL